MRSIKKRLVKLEKVANPFSEDQMNECANKVMRDLHKIYGDGGPEPEWMHYTKVEAIVNAAIISWEFPDGNIPVDYRPFRFGSKEVYCGGKYIKL